MKDEVLALVTCKLTLPQLGLKRTPLPLHIGFPVCMTKMQKLVFVMMNSPFLPFGTQNHFPLTCGPSQRSIHQGWRRPIKPSRLSWGRAGWSPLCIFQTFILSTLSPSHWIYKWVLNWITSRWISVLSQKLAVCYLVCGKWEFSEVNFSSSSPP